MNRLPSLNDYMDAACEFTGITFQEIVSKGRTVEVVRARSLYASASHMSGRYSWPDIGQFIHRRSHSTVANAGRRVEGDKKLKREARAVFRRAHELAARAAEQTPNPTREEM